MAGETGPSLERQAAWAVVNAAFMAALSEAWPTVRLRLAVLLSRPGDDAGQDLQGRLDRTQQQMDASSQPAMYGWGVPADVWYDQVQRWSDLFRGVLDDQPELAGGLADLIDELATRFGVPSDHPAPEDQAKTEQANPSYSPPRPDFPKPAPNYAPEQGSPPGASFGDDDDIGERGSPPGASIGDHDDLDG